jgi:hypothetical protein
MEDAPMRTLKDLFKKSRPVHTEDVIYSHDGNTDVIELPRTEWRRIDNPVAERKMRFFTPTQEQQL